MNVIMEKGDVSMNVIIFMEGISVFVRWVIGLGRTVGVVRVRFLILAL